MTWEASTEHLTVRDLAQTILWVLDLEPDASGEPSIYQCAKYFSTNSVCIFNFNVLLYTLLMFIALFDVNLIQFAWSESNCFLIDVRFRAIN